MSQESEKSPAPKPLIVTQEQYAEGFVTLVGRKIYRRPFRVLGRTPKGHYVVEDPATERPIAEIR